MRTTALLVGFLIACSRQPTPQPPPSNEVRFTGMCDASGAVALDERTFLVADDEDNVLRVYDANQGGPPLTAVDVSPSLGLAKGKKKGAPELDIEAATRVGGLAYFITSHGRNSSGKLKPERLRFFATTASGQPQLVGKPYERLLEDLFADPRLSTFELRAASELAPKSPGGLNIEGMTARAEGGVWLGFRNPIPHGKALLVPLLNPEQLIEGGSSRFGDPVTLELGGLGVRALSAVGARYLVAAGPFDSGPGGKLFTWDGGETAEPLRSVDVSGYNPEAFFSADPRRVLILSDDGSHLVGGKDCKRAPVSERRFRGVWAPLP
jgi:hypothetical protein